MTKKDLIKLGQMIKQVRKSAGITQEELVKKTSKPRFTLVKFERGEVEDLSFLFFCEVCDALGLYPEMVLKSLEEKEDLIEKDISLSYLKEQAQKDCLPLADMIKLFKKWLISKGDL
jgi:transcriptional regulator with XRE-family HTH domain